MMIASGIDSIGAANRSLAVGLRRILGWIVIAAIIAVCASGCGPETEIDVRVLRAQYEVGGMTFATATDAVREASRLRAKRVRLLTCKESPAFNIVQLQRELTGAGIEANVVLTDKDCKG